jgi:NCS1 family nucleobase:cation symporter-1
VQSVELGAVKPADQTQSPADLFLIFVGANVVATTLQVGASLAGRWSFSQATTLILIGAFGGAALVAALAPLGPRLGVPSIVASRAALGLSGAQLLAFLLFATNFAWIALNNVIAASICARLLGGEGSMPIWAVGLGVVATLIVAGGPRMVGLADRFAVPALAVCGLVMTIACLRAPWPPVTPSTSAVAPGGLFGAVDIVAGYQATWLLMFADYSRYNRSGKASAVAVFLGLGLSAAWFIPLGYAAATIAGSDDPGAMVQALRLGWWGAVLMVMATLSTNFVNIYMSALALKSLRPSTPDNAGVWLIGGLGAALSVLSSAWLNQFASVTLLVAGLLVPIGGILLAHYFFLRRQVRVGDLYEARGPYAKRAGWSVAGTAAWAAGAAAFFFASPIGGTLPSLAVAIVVYSALSKR